MKLKYPCYHQLQNAGIWSEEDAKPRDLSCQFRSSCQNESLSFDSRMMKGRGKEMEK